jgi:hypothetical protein
MVSCLRRRKLSGATELKEMFYLEFHIHNLSNFGDISAEDDETVKAFVKSAPSHLTTEIFTGQLVLVSR